MDAKEYLDRSRLYQRLRNGPHGQLIERFAARLIEARFAPSGIWHSLNIVGDLLRWIADLRYELADIDEHIVGRYLRHRSRRLSIQNSDLPALKRWLAVLRENDTIAPAIAPPLIPRDVVFKEFEAYLRSERGLTPGSIARHRPIILRFLHDTHVENASDLRKISQEDVIRHIESHARDYSPATGRAMCSSLRTFLHYLHYRGLHPLAAQPVLAIPSKRYVRRPVAFLSSWIGRRDRALLLLAVQTGLRAAEIVGLRCEDIVLGPAAYVQCQGKGRKLRNTRFARIRSRCCVPGLPRDAGGAPILPSRRQAARH